jgi:hypothetical protein
MGIPEIPTAAVPVLARPRTHLGRRVGIARGVERAQMPRTGIIAQRMAQYDQ